MRNRIAQNGHVGKETMGDKGKGDRIIGDWHLALTTYFGKHYVVQDSLKIICLCSKRKATHRS